MEGVGDIHSKELGSGARHNAGKTRYDLLPLALLFEQFDAVDADRAWGEVDPYEKLQDPDAVLRLLADWQRIGAPQFLRMALYRSVGHAYDYARLDLRLLKPACDVLEYGVRKYAAWNWARGSEWSVPFACAIRHLVQVISNAEELDKESGCSHMAHVTCNIIFLMQYQFYQQLNDMPFNVLVGKCHI